MTDVPYGRGGSPLQNLVARGHRDTLLSALRMTAELDAGPVYLKRALALDGRAQEIYQRMADLCYDMMAEIVAHEPTPEPQSGEVVRFARRTPAQSVLPAQAALAQLHDHIRMLDAETYPSAFIEYGDFRIEFHHARHGDDQIEAQVTIRRRVRNAGSGAS
jgi:methionyl-tRNA formyltransferase